MARKSAGGKKLKVGVVGTGNCFNWGHREALLKHPELELYALCDIVEEKAVKFAKDHDVKHVFADYRELLKLEEIDVVDVITPNLFHSEVAVAALNAGKHVFTEKPDAVSVAECQKMVAAARKSGKVLMSMRNNRFRSDAQFLRRYIAAGKMGELYHGRCGWQRRRGIPGKGGWFTTKQLSGGGPLIDLGVHMLDLAVWLMGNPKPVAVTGATYCKFAKSQTKADSEHAKFGEAKSAGTFDVEDLAGGVVRFDNGAMLHLEFSWASNIEVERNFVEVAGELGGFGIASDKETRIYTEIDGCLCDIVPKCPKAELGGHASHLHHFVDVLRGRAKPINTPQDGLDIIKILCAVYESASTGKEVRL
jgi:predicted dehydrogenase